MSTIPSGQKFRTVDAGVDTVEKQSSRLNSYGEIYTMQDVADTVTDAIPAAAAQQYIIQTHNDNNNIALNRIWAVVGTSATDRLYGYGRLLIPFNCQLKSIRFSTEFLAGAYTLQVGNGTDVVDNSNLSVVTLGDTGVSHYVTHVTGTIAGASQTDYKALHEFTGVNFTKGEDMFVMTNFAAAPGQTPVQLIFEAV